MVSEEGGKDESECAWWGMKLTPPIFQPVLKEAGSDSECVQLLLSFRSAWLRELGALEFRLRIFTPCLCICLCFFLRAPHDCE